MNLISPLDINLSKFRAIMFIAVTVNPLWHFIMMWLVPNATDPVVHRLSASSLCMFLLIGSYFYEYSEKTCNNLMIFVAYLFTAHVHYIAYLNAFSPMYGLGYFMVLACAPTVLPTRKSFLLYCTFSVALMGGIGFFGPGDKAFIFLFIICQLTIYTIQYLGSVKKWDAIEIANDHILLNSEHQHKMASLGDATAGLAHEIKNILSVALLSTELGLQKSKKHPGGNELADYFTKTQSNLKRIAKLVVSLQSYASTSESEEFEITELLPLCNEAKGIVASKSYKYETNIEIAVPENIHVNCKRYQLLQVLVNLLNNAIEATDSVSNRWVRLECEVTASAKVLKVIDSGLGVPVEYRRKVFAPHFTTKPLGLGAGLGLSISHTLIQNQGGSLTFDNHCKNTCFAVTFNSVNENLVGTSSDSEEFNLVV